MKPDGWVTVAEAAQIVDCTPATIYNWIAKRILHADTKSGPLAYVNAAAVVQAREDVKVGRPIGSYSHNTRRLP